jgi:hypothetical protein
LIDLLQHESFFLALFLLARVLYYRQNGYITTIFSKFLTTLLTKSFQYLWYMCDSGSIRCKSNLPRLHRDKLSASTGIWTQVSRMSLWRTGTFNTCTVVEVYIVNTKHHLEIRPSNFLVNINT